MLEKIKKNKREITTMGVGAILGIATMCFANKYGYIYGCEKMFAYTQSDSDMTKDLKNYILKIAGEMGVENLDSCKCSVWDLGGRSFVARASSGKEYVLNVSEK